MGHTGAVWLKACMCVANYDILSLLAVRPSFRLAGASCACSAATAGWGAAPAARMLRGCGARRPVRARGALAAARWRAGVGWAGRLLLYTPPLLALALLVGSVSGAFLHAAGSHQLRSLPVVCAGLDLVKRHRRQHLARARAGCVEFERIMGQRAAWVGTHGQGRACSGPCRTTPGAATSHTPAHPHTKKSARDRLHSHPPLTVSMTWMYPAPQRMLPLTTCAVVPTDWIATRPSGPAATRSW